MVKALPELAQLKRVLGFISYDYTAYYTTYPYWPTLIIIDNNSHRSLSSRVRELARLPFLRVVTGNTRKDIPGRTYSSVGLTRWSPLKGV
eukprot:2961117-Pyramimonas_sp.AAC.3